MREVGRGANGERGSRARRGYRWGGAPIGLRVVVGGPCAALPSRVAFGCPPGQRWVTGGARGDTWGRARGQCRFPRWRETAGGRPAAPGEAKERAAGLGDGWN
jgi:hypothetical protein